MVRRTQATIPMTSPLRSISWRSPIHHERVGAILGLALGVTFATCFATGVYSHLLQNPPPWFTAPARPAGLYRITQGVHVATGIASIPLLLAKLWAVFPKLFEWPPFTGVLHAVQRLTLIALVGGSLFELLTGVANIDLWYPWRFNFRVAHYWVAWITIGALVVHAGAKWGDTRAAVARTSEPDPEPDGAVDRRRFLTSIFATSGLLVLFSVGQTVRPLSRLALLAPRRPNVGPQGFPVNRTAAEAGVENAATNTAYRLVVDGKVRRPLTLSLHQLFDLPQHEAVLPISCVDGWSASKRWTGVSVRQLLQLAGARADAEVTVHSLQQQNAYRSSDLDVSEVRDPDTLLALRVDGEPLHIDHGYPVRLIGPNRPGVLQTKWVQRVVVR
jgi:DMSO/TMAO reductase YedYZ molybdopterin-dependent catalytic subunit